MKKRYIKIIAMLLAAWSSVSVLSSCINLGNSTDTTVDTSGEDNGVAEYIDISNGILTPGKYYANPLAGSAADPMIVEHEGVFYLYSTGNTTLSVRTSKNLLTWSDPKQIFALSQTGWGVKNCWAPEVHKYNGKFYLFFCGRDSSGIFHGSVAVCDTPDGTFVPVTKEPLLNFNYSIIDLSFFCDDDGRTYILYSKDCSTNVVNGKKVSQSYGVEVSNDFTRTIGEHVLLTTPDVSWEMKSGNTIWNEGPVVFKRNGKYYILYSANYYQSADYGIGYAVADSILGPYTKPKSNCLVQGNGTTITGPGHNNLLFFGDEIYIVYHAHTIPPNTDNGRSLYINQLIVKDDGTLYVNGPNQTRQPLPDGINGTKKYDGTVKVSASIADSIQKPQNLVDKIASKGYDGVVHFAEGDSVTFTFDTPADIDVMWIYGSYAYGSEAATVDVIINDTYIIDGIKFSTSRGGIATAVFSKLPEGTMIEKLTLTNFKAPEPEKKGDEVGPVGITEVMFITYENK